MTTKTLVAAAAALAALTVGTQQAQAAADSLLAPAPGGGAQFAWTAPASGSGVPVVERRLAGDGSLSEVQAVSPVFRSGLGPSVATDAAGNAYITWLGNDGSVDGSYIRKRAADGSLGPIQLLSPRGVKTFTPRLAVEPDGDAFAVWLRQLSGRQVLQGRRRAANGALGPVLTLSYVGADVDFPDLAVSATTGAATVVWRRFAADPEKTYVQSRTIAADSSLGSTMSVTLPADGVNVENPQVGASDSGTAIYGWTRHTSDTGARALLTRARSAGGTLSTPQTVAPVIMFPQPVRMATNGSGRTVFTFATLDGMFFSSKGRVRQAGGTLGPAFEISATGWETETAIDPAGNTVFAWQQVGANNEIHWRRRTAGGTLGSAKTVSDPNVTSSGPHVVVDAAGRSTVGWTTGSAIRARSVSPSGSLSPIRFVSENG